MILKQEFETLYSTRYNNDLYFQNGDEIDIKELTKMSESICDKWEDYICDNEKEINFKIDDDMQFIYKTEYGEERKADISEFAFSQLCARVGVPASYVKKCFDNGKISLALQNFHEWSGDCDKKLLIREQDGVVRAVLSDSYRKFDSYRVMRTLQNTVDTSVYKVNGAYLSSDKLHLRFVNRNALDINEKSPMYSGFTVSSSDVGRGSLNMTFFLYRQVCDNGMTITEKGGTLFRQPHIGSAMTDGKLELFNKAFLDIDCLTERALELIRTNQSKMLKDYEMQMYLEKVRRELKISKKSQDEIIYLMDNVYDHSRWGLLNSVTEIAQKFTLDTRIEFETFAGNTMIRVA